MTAKRTWLYFTVGLVVLTLAGTAALAVADSDRQGTAIYGDADNAAIYFGTYAADAEQADATVVLRDMAPRDISDITILRNAGATALYSGADFNLLMVEDAKKVSHLGPRELAVIGLTAAKEAGNIGPLWVVDGVPMAAQVGIIGGADGPTAICTGFVPPVVDFPVDLYLPTYYDYGEFLN